MTDKEQPQRGTSKAENIIMGLLALVAISGWVALVWIMLIIAAGKG